MSLNFVSPLLPLSKIHCKIDYAWSIYPVSTPKAAGNNFCFEDAAGFRPFSTGYGKRAKLLVKHGRDNRVCPLCYRHCA